MNNEVKRPKKQWQTAIILFAFSFIAGGIFVYMEARLGARTDEIIDVPIRAAQSLQNLCITEGLVGGIVSAICATGIYLLVVSIRHLLIKPHKLQ